MFDLDFHCTSRSARELTKEEEEDCQFDDN